MNIIPANIKKYVMCISVRTGEGGGTYLKRTHGTFFDHQNFKFCRSNVRSKLTNVKNHYFYLDGFMHLGLLPGI